jgi:hypothetical protein
MVEKHFNDKIAPVRSRGGSLVTNKKQTKAIDYNDNRYVIHYNKTYVALAKCLCQSNVYIREMYAKQGGRLCHRESWPSYII